MMAILCASAIVLGLLGGRRWSVLALLIASPVLWAACAVALGLGGRPIGEALLYALAPVVAAQIAFFAGAQMRLDARGARAGADRPAPEKAEEPAVRPARQAGGR